MGRKREVMGRVVGDCDKVSGADGVSGMFLGKLERVTMRAVHHNKQQMTDWRRPFARYEFAQRFVDG